MPTYSRGDWIAVVVPGASALFASGLPDERATGLYEALTAEPGPGAIIGSLVGSFGSSLGALPSFAAVFLDPESDELRVMVRGTAQVRVTGVDGSVQQVSGLGVSTWVERSVPAVAEAELIGEGDEQAVLPLVDGIAAAGRMLWRIAAIARTAMREDDAPAVAWDPAVAEAVAPLAAAPEPVATDESDSGGGPSRRDDAAAAPTGSEGSAGSSDQPGIAGETIAAPIGETLATAPEGPDAGFGEDAEEADAGAFTRGYEHLLFGETRAGVVEDAAVRAAPEPQTAVVVDPLTEAPEQHDSAGAIPPVVLSPVATQTGPRPLITGIPQTGAAAAASAPQQGDHDGETVSTAHLAALLGQQVGSAASEAPTPARAHPVLIVSTGQRVVLDRSAVIGRRPRAVRATGEIPHLVSVDSPNNDISRSHVELGLAAGDVVATDLGTTNGTWLLRANAEPVRLQPGDAALLVAGDRLDLGEGVQLSFEGLR